MEHDRTTHKATLFTEGDRQVVVTRRFAAPVEAIYRAHTEPALIQQWMLGPDGWTMPVCIYEARRGGQIRFELTDSKGSAFHMTGECLEVEPFRRIVHIHRLFLPDPTPDNHIETSFEADGEATVLTVRMTLPDEETRRQMLATGIEEGMEANYSRLERQLQQA